MEYNIRNMAGDLVEAGIIKEEQKEKAIEVLKKEWEDKIALIWCRDDVMERAKEMGKEITEEQADEVLGLMDRKHDCNYGVTWDTIDCYLDL